MQQVTKSNDHWAEYLKFSAGHILFYGKVGRLKLIEFFRSGFLKEKGDLFYFKIYFNSII